MESNYLHANQLETSDFYNPENKNSFDIAWKAGMEYLGKKHLFSYKQNAVISQWVKKEIENYPNNRAIYLEKADKVPFNKKNYKNIPEKVERQIWITENHIYEQFHCNKTDWKEDIYDFVELNKYSFGNLGLGWFWYFYLLVNILADPKFDFIPHEKSLELAHDLNSIIKGKSENKYLYQKLQEINQKWLKIFPFDLNYFAAKKEVFKGFSPMGVLGRTNRYTGMTSVKLIDEKTLKNYLTETTKNLLATVNVPQLKKIGNVTDLQSDQIEILDAELKIKNTNLLEKLSTGEQQYVEILENWLQNQKDYFKEIVPIVKEIEQQKPTKSKTSKNTESNIVEYDSTPKLIFKGDKTLTKIYDELKGFFPDKESDFHKALTGETLNEKLIFPSNQNKFVEVFARLKYNGLLNNQPKKIKVWICSNFQYKYSKGNKTEYRDFSKYTVHDILTKGKGEPSKKERIRIDWLPFKPFLKR